MTEPTSNQPQYEPVPPTVSATPEMPMPGEPLPPMTAPLPATKKGLGIAALVLGAVAFVFAWIPLINFLAIIVAIIGLILGIVALVIKDQSKPLAITGTIFSAVALALSIVLVFVYSAVLIAGIDSATSSEVAVQEDSVSSEGVDEPVESDEDASAAGEVGTRANPAPIGTTVTFSRAGVPEWEVTLGASTLNANEIVAAENEFNDAPPEGMQWAIVPITTTYVGTESANPWFDLSVSFVSTAGTTHESFDEFVLIPDDWTSANDLYPGGSATGNVGVAIPIEDAENGAWVVSQLFGEEVFFTAH